MERGGPFRDARVRTREGHEDAGGAGHGRVCVQDWDEATEDVGRREDGEDEPRPRREGAEREGAGGGDNDATGVRAAIDEEVRAFIESAHQEAYDLLVANREALDAVVVALMERETLDKTEIEEIFRELKLREPRGAWTGSARRAPDLRGPVAVAVNPVAEDQVAVGEAIEVASVDSSESNV